MNSDWIELQDRPLDANRAIEFVTDSCGGGIAVFLGTTRAETHKSGRALESLDYQAYAEMASKQMENLARGARERWPILKLAILHRTGIVRLGEPSVVIAVSTPHRAEAFDVCRWIIDTLKAEVAIWKKEVWADGSGTWVHPNEGGTEGQRD